VDRIPSNYNPLSTFYLSAGGSRHYQQQYADMYFLRLAKLKPPTAAVAANAWEGFNVRDVALLLSTLDIVCQVRSRLIETADRR
jgi:hypothetical protein